MTKFTKNIKMGIIQLSSTLTSLKYVPVSLGIAKDDRCSNLYACAL